MNLLSADTSWAPHGNIKVLLIKLFIDGAFLCLIVLYAWDSGAQGGYGGS